MAIQFHCPSCEAVIRVPDAAAGKKGTCPRCNEKLLVPDIAAESPVAPVNAPVNPSLSNRPGKVELPRLDPTVTPGLPQLDLKGGSPRPDVTAPTHTTSSSAGLPRLDVVTPSSIGLESPRKSRGKPKTTPTAWIVPALCILTIAGFIAWFMWSAEPKLEGTLTAHVVHDPDIKPGLIPGKLSGLKSNELGEVLRHLKAQPAHWASMTSKFTLTGTADGVQVAIDNGSAAHFVSVEPTQSPAFVEYLKRHMNDLDKPRQAAIETHAPKLFADWKRQFTKNDPVTNQLGHVDFVVLPTMVSGLGYHVEAVVNKNVYPCVYEDDGALYFLLPNATKSFLLRGRQVSGGLDVPANFTVKISGSGTGSVSRKKPKRKTAEERELENEGMSPELDKSEKGDTPAEGEMPEENENMLSDEKPDMPAGKSKTATKKRPTMMDDADMMDDEMPAKSLPKKKPATKKVPE